MFPCLLTVEVGAGAKIYFHHSYLCYLAQPIINYHTSMHHFDSKIAKNPTRKGDTPSRTQFPSNSSMSTRVPCEQQLNMGQLILRDRRIPFRPSLCAPHPRKGIRSIFPNPSMEINVWEKNIFPGYGMEKKNNQA